MTTIVGIDIGRVADHTAVVVLKDWNVTLIEQFPLGLEFKDITGQLDKYCQRADWAFVDQSGVGDPVVEHLRDTHGTKIIGIRITGGKTARTGGRQWRVGKGMLMEYLMRALIEKIKVTAPDPGRTQLREELKDFEQYQGRTLKWGAKPGSHDDIVLALALAVVGKVCGADRGLL